MYCRIYLHCYVTLSLIMMYLLVGAKWNGMVSSQCLIRRMDPFQIVFGLRDGMERDVHYVFHWTDGME